MQNYPALWFRNIVYLLEKRRYDTYVIFLFAIFVGTARSLAELTLGETFYVFATSALVNNIGFYFYMFFMYTAIIRLFIADPWRRSINVILVGIFIGIFPPLIDTLAAGGRGGFYYMYYRTFPDGWSWLFYHPEAGFPLGETITLWMAIALTVAYVRLRSRSIGKAAGAGILVYLMLTFTGAILPTLASKAHLALGWPRDSRWMLIMLGHILIPLLVYLGLQPRLLRGWLRQAAWSLPAGLMCLAGGFAAGNLSVEVYLYAGVALLFPLFFVALEASRSADAAFADAEDVKFLAVTLAMLTATFLLLSTAAGVFFALALAMAFLLVSPTPHRVLAQLCFGLSGFLAGWAAATEHAAVRQPHWFMGGTQPTSVRGVPENIFVLIALYALAVAAAIAAARYLRASRNAAAEDPSSGEV